MLKCKLAAALFYIQLDQLRTVLTGWMNIR